MAQSVWSAYGSPLHLVLEDSFAEAYNRSVEKFLEAQNLHKMEHGHQWDPLKESLKIYWTDEEQDAFGKYADLLNMMIDINGGGLDIDIEDCPSDYLVKVES